MKENVQNYNDHKCWLMVGKYYSKYETLVIYEIRIMNLYGSRRYSRMDQVRFVEASLCVILTITRIILKISSLCLMEIKNNFENQSKVVSNLFHDILPVWLEANTPIL